jgi:hypothetical protein
MSRSMAYVTFGPVQGHPGGNDAPPEGIDLTGVFLNVGYVTVSPSNKTGISGSLVIPFNFGDDCAAVFEAVKTLVAADVKAKTGTEPKVHILGQEEVK